jgi:uncharacterized membrane protein
MSDTKVSWTDSMTQKMASFFEKEHIQTAIRNRVLDPIMNHILKRIYPYIVLICVMFSLLLISVLLTLAVIIFKIHASVPSVSSVPSVQLAE